MNSSTPARKVILITGASSGMVRETALRLLREGHTVYGAARRLERRADKPWTRYAAASTPGS